jgi:uncharacterized membrane protein YdjX (TVP38/TMEM64 family)
MSRRTLPMLLALGMLVAALVWRIRSDDSALELGQRFIDGARGRWWALPLYVVIGIARPVMLLPATLLTVVAGVLFGPWLGVVAAALAANGSAMLVFWFGVALGLAGPDADASSRWRQRLHSRTFESTLIARLLFVPYDAVNLAAGALRVRATPFMAATAIGSLPGTTAFVIAGGSIRRLDQGWDGVNLVGIAVSVVVIVASLFLARVVRRRIGA